MTDLATLIDLRTIEEAAQSHPLLRGLLRELPPAHTVWSLQQRQRWLEMAASILTLLYEEEEHVQEVSHCSHRGALSEASRAEAEVSTSDT